MTTYEIKSYCDCCGRRFTSVTVYTNQNRSLTICHRCYSWKPYGAQTPNKRVNLNDLSRPQ